MQSVQLLFVLVILIGRINLSELRIVIKMPGELAELEEAAIQVLTTCYANHTKTIALVGDYSSSFIKRLSAHESFSLVLLHDTIRSENSIENLDDIDQSRKHRVHILVAMVRNQSRFRRVLVDFWYSLYDNPMALTIVLVWDPEKKDAGCDAKYKTAEFLYHSNRNNHLNTILMCHHHNTGIMLYSSNPFKNQAPEPWKQVPFQKTVWEKSFFYFVRKYQVHEEMCKNLAFDRTRDLNGWGIKTDVPGTLVRRKNESIQEWSSIRLVRLEQQKDFGVISRFISHVNASTVLGNGNFKRTASINWDYFKVPCNSFRGLQLWHHYHTYPNSLMTTFLVSQFRGNKSQLSKILGVIDDYSWVGMFIVYLITLLFFKYFLRQPLLIGILNLCRLTCNWGLPTLPRNAAPQVYLSCLLFFVVTMQGIFTGNLAALLTHDFPVRQINSIKDVIDLDYTVYCERSDVILLTSAGFKGRIITIENDENCIEQVKLDARAVCVAYKTYIKIEALESNLYVSPGSIDVEWESHIVPWRWGLLERFNTIQGILNDAGATIPFQTMVDEKRLLEAEAVEVELEPEVMIWEDLRFAFVILGIGLVCASITFIGEIAIHGYYRRKTTTRVIVLRR